MMAAPDEEARKIVEFISKVDVFATFLSDEQITEVAKELRCVSFSDGEFIIRQQATEDLTLYIIETGQVVEKFAQKQRGSIVLQDKGSFYSGGEALVHAVCLVIACLSCCGALLSKPLLRAFLFFITTEHFGEKLVLGEVPSRESNFIAVGDVTAFALDRAAYKKFPKDLADLLTERFLRDHHSRSEECDHLMREALLRFEVQGEQDGLVNSAQVLSALAEVGILEDDVRIRDAVKAMKALGGTNVSINNMVDLLRVNGR